MKIPVILSLLIFLSCMGTGCSTSKPGRQLTYWEYRDLAGVDVSTNPEAQKLLKDGWIFLGYSLPYPKQNYRVDFPAGYPPVLMGFHGRYNSTGNAICPVTNFRRIVKIVDAP
jgi:hypothetical protein